MTVLLETTAAEQVRGGPFGYNSHGFHPWLSASDVGDFLVSCLGMPNVMSVVEFADNACRHDMRDFRSLIRHLRYRLVDWFQSCSFEHLIEEFEMTSPPVSQEIAGALAAYFFGGVGPSHAKLTTAFLQGGYSDACPYNISDGTPNKETRVQRTVMAAVRKPDRARQLIDAMLVPLRIGGYFDPDRNGYDASAFKTLRKAFARQGWSLTDDGELSPISGLDLSTGGRDSLDEQLARIRKSTDDPGALLGAAKDLLEAVAKFVLEEVGMPQPKSAKFPQLWHLSRDRLGILPQQVDTTIPGADSIRQILQSAWTIADQVNDLRGLQGTGHGRTLPTGVSADLALLVVREACSVAEFMLTTLDRQLGRSDS